MSHVTKTELPVEMTDKDCILRAAKFLGCKHLKTLKLSVGGARKQRRNCLKTQRQQI